MKQGGSHAPSAAHLRNFLLEAGCSSNSRGCASHACIQVAQPTPLSSRCSLTKGASRHTRGHRTGRGRGEPNNGHRQRTPAGETLPARTAPRSCACVSPSPPSLLQGIEALLDPIRPGACCEGSYGYPLDRVLEDAKDVSLLCVNSTVLLGMEYILYDLFLPNWDRAQHKESVR
ncbi:hypothetical protein NDU88_000689 [Pleurodeles waltl]|uniref:Uncharacterized protein n=1 Tax=Pleurodeles waltl TaxID=8319 RepID=A0AAV7LWI9_PLEWA|nr:hypothetical protein NDU88_000689 [Pleurodeles waltl]